MARRDEEKKRRRQKRLDKQKAHPQRSSAAAGDELSKLIADVQRHAKVAQPAHWPGAADPTLERPDIVKFDFANFGTKRSPGRQKCAQFARDIGRGPLGLVPQIEHWAWEEFLYHGVPGDSWHPLDTYLEHGPQRYPPTAAEQLRRWKEARIGVYEVGDVAEDTVGLREWDQVRQTHVGAPVRAITLNIGGVNLHSQHRGQLLLTYLAPWRPDQELYCGMGYGATVPKKGSDFLVLLLGLRHPDVASRPLPWKRDRAALEAHQRAWRQRDWYTWFQERLTFPFHALVPLPPSKLPQIVTIGHLVPSTPDQVRRFGVYFDASPNAEQAAVIGGTGVTPIDIASPNFLPFLEYLAYRDYAGPPPGTVGVPTFGEFRPLR